MSENKTTRAVFRPRARIMLQLGEQLIRNESIALLELVKNCYDADASTVHVGMEAISSPHSGCITIEDNGVGMSLDIVENVWMEPGSDFKERLYTSRKTTAKYGRLPLGEKGIGRFGVHKLGDEIILVTRCKDGPEICVHMDWSVFRQSKYLEDVPIEIVRRTPQVFRGSKTGTRISVRRLRASWTRGTVRDIQRSINSMCSPFESPDFFDVTLDLGENNDWLEGLLSWRDIKEYALYHARCTIEGDEIRKFRYRFRPWDAMNKLSPRTITEKDEYFQKVKRMVQGTRRKSEPLNLSNFAIGKVHFEVLIFDRSPKILSLGVQDKKGLKEYLDQNGGIRVYRDGIRVYDYGEPGNDWLNLGVRRVNVPTKRISNNLVLGAVHLRREESGSLLEKANREGFIENEAYHHLKAAILYTLDKIEAFRNPDKERVQLLYGPSQQSEPVTASIASLRQVVDAQVKDRETRKELTKYIDRIEQDYQTITETLLKSAGAGLSLSIVIHEVEKIVGELLAVLKKTKASERILHLTRHLAQLVEGYSFVIRGSGVKEESLAELIEQALFNIEFRLRAHDIDVTMDYSRPLTHPRVKCARRFVINSILNVFDNSIWWLDYYQIAEKRVYVTLSEEMNGYTTIIIADNGKGFSLPTEEIRKPFVSGKPGEMGMGIGLHLADETMNVQKGLLLFPEWGDFSIPNEFKGGAVVALCFRH